MTSSVNAVKRKSDGIYGIFGVTVLRLLHESNRRGLVTKLTVKDTSVSFCRPPSWFLQPEALT